MRSPVLVPASVLVWLKACPRSWGTLLGFLGVPLYRRVSPSFSLFMQISSHVQFVLSGNGSEALKVLGGLDTPTVHAHFLASFLLCCAMLCLRLSWNSAALHLYGPFSSHILHFLTVIYCQKSLVGSTAIWTYALPPLPPTTWLPSPFHWCLVSLLKEWKQQ